MEIVGFTRGLGRHEYYLTSYQQQEAGEYSALSQTFCIMSLGVGKISICISLLRIISGANRKVLKWFLYVMLALQFIVNVLVSTTIFMQCTPSRKLWTPDLPGSCWDPATQLDMDYLQAGMPPYGAKAHDFADQVHLE